MQEGSSTANRERWVAEFYSCSIHDEESSTSTRQSTRWFLFHRCPLTCKKRSGSAGSFPPGRSPGSDRRDHGTRPRILKALRGGFER